MLIPQELAVNFAIVFEPVAQLFVFPTFHVCYYTMRKLKIKEILKLIILKFVIMVLLLRKCLSFNILGVSDFVILPT